MNKKGAGWLQEHLGETLLIVVVLALVGYGAYVWLYKTPQKVAGVIPDELSLAATACENLAKEDMLESVYCLQARPTSDDNKKVTCGYLFAQGYIKNKMETGCIKTPAEVANLICKDRKASEPKLWINGVECAKVA
jgi:hypothetical protein